MALVIHGTCLVILVITINYSSQRLSGASGPTDPFTQFLFLGPCCAA